MAEPGADADGLGSPSYNDVIVFPDAEAEVITARAPTYNDVIVFPDAEAEIITARAPTYNDVIVFPDSQAEIITANAPLQNSGEVVFTDEEVDPIVGTPPPYEVIAFDDSEAEIISARRPLPTGGPYQQTVVFNDAEGLVIEGTRAQRRELGSDSVGYGAVRGGASPGKEQLNRPITIRTTGPSDRPPWWPDSTGISFELQDAWSLPAPSDIQTELPLPQTQVLSWLRKYQDLIVAAEKRWRVDRRAIAAAITWEALVNVRSASIRAAGPAKVHTNADVVQEVEAAGYLPRQSAAARRDLLKTPAGAITYVAAIMNAKATIAEALGFPSIRNRVDILTNEFQGRSLQQWTDHLLEKKDTVFIGQNTMSSWAAQHLQYLELGVGVPDNAAINAPPP